MHQHVPSAIDQQLGEMMSDAPFCDICDHVTIRNSACYKSLSCGNSLCCSSALNNKACALSVLRGRRKWVPKTEGGRNGGSDR